MRIGLLLYDPGQNVSRCLGIPHSSHLGTISLPETLALKLSNVIEINRKRDFISAPIPTSWVKSKGYDPQL